MQENPTFQVEKTFPQEKKETASAFILSIVALLIVVVFTGTMFALRIQKEATIESMNTEISQIQWQISTLESDKKNSVASLIEGNSIPSISLTPLIRQFMSLATSSQVQFQGFNIQNDTITTNLTAINSDKDAVQKILSLMKTFAQTGQQGTFALEPILSISGNRETRTTPVTFKIVPIKEEKATENAAENQQQ